MHLQLQSLIFRRSSQTPADCEGASTPPHPTKQAQAQQKTVSSPGANNFKNTLSHARSVGQDCRIIDPAHEIFRTHEFRKSNHRIASTGTSTKAHNQGPAMLFLPRSGCLTHGTIPIVPHPWKFSNMRIGSSAQQTHAEIRGIRLSFLPARPVSPEESPCTPSRFPEPTKNQNPAGTPGRPRLRKSLSPPDEDLKQADRALLYSLCPTLQERLPGLSSRATFLPHEGKGQSWSWVQKSSGMSWAILSAPFAPP